jgi:hypothetical protein
MNLASGLIARIWNATKALEYEAWHIKMLLLHSADSQIIKLRLHTNRVKDSIRTHIENLECNDGFGI